MSHGARKPSTNRATTTSRRRLRQAWSDEWRAWSKQRYLAKEAGKPTDELTAAADALAARATALADAAAQLRLAGTLELRRFANDLSQIVFDPRPWETRASPDLWHVVEDVLAVVEAESEPDRPENGIDLVNDPACRSLRDILRTGPKRLGAIEKDTRSPSRRLASKMLAAMATVGMVDQTRAKGPWRLLSDKPRVG